MIIRSRFNGPPGTGNGGYSAGLCAVQSSPGQGAVEVTLRMPPPLDEELTPREEDAVLRVYTSAGDLVAEARESTVDEVVAPVSWADAVEVSRDYPGFRSHPFPTCFVCGTERAVGDGLRLFPGRLPDRRTATPFTVPDEIAPELVWAALDCPGGWSVPLEGRPYVLGRIAARVDEPPAPGQRCVVMGQMTGEDGQGVHGVELVRSGGRLAGHRPGHVDCGVKPGRFALPVTVYDSDR
jgi:hypothetical protein